jgi:hypothetical protein
VGLRSLTETIDTAAAGGRQVFHIFRTARGVRVCADSRVNPRRAQGSRSSWPIGRPALSTFL